MKRIRVLSILMVLALLVCCAPVGAAASEWEKIEGEGFDTPDEAILAYAEALKTGDPEAMIATFCVETYCEHYDAAAFYSLMGMVSTAQFPTQTLPAENSVLMQRMNYERRRSGILGFINSQLTYYALFGSAYEEVLTNMSMRLEEKDIRPYLEEASDISGLSSMKIGEVMEPDDVTDIAAIAERSADRYGYDELAFRAVHLEIDGKPWFLTMDIARYGDRWYNLNPMGVLFMYLGEDIITGGLIPG